MAKVVALVASALCILAIASLAQCHKEVFNVEGKVYCDTCRVLFQTRVSEYLAGAEVELQCRSRETGAVTVTVPGKTNKQGHYSIVVSGEHENDICEVTAISSPNPNCSESKVEINVAKISLTGNSGILSSSRYCNPIGFVKKKSLPNCDQVLGELGLVPIVD